MLNIQARSNLSEFSHHFDVARDASFYTAAKIPTRAPAKLVPLTSAKYLRELHSHLSEIAGVVCTADLAAEIPDDIGCAVAAKPIQAVFRVHQELHERPNHFWARFPSRIASSASVHPSAYVAESDVHIGDNCVVGPNAVILERSILGRDCYIGANTTIGTDAYEINSIDGRPRLLAQAGGVRLGNGVIILSNCTIARSSFPTLTEIGDESSFDNLVHVAHDCQLGKRVKMTACSILSGRVTLGDDVYIGPNATISNGLTVGDKAYISLGAVVVSDIEAGKKMTGNFAVEHTAFKRQLIASQRA